MAATNLALRRLETKLTRETLWIYISRLLQDKPMYGYEIREMVKQRFNFEPAIVTAYVVLYKMTKEGLVAFKVERNPNGKPDRKYYYITPKGNQTLENARILVDHIYERVFDRTPYPPKENQQ